MRRTARVLSSHSQRTDSGAENDVLNTVRGQGEQRH